MSALLLHTSFGQNSTTSLATSSQLCARSKHRTISSKNIPASDPKQLSKSETGTHASDMKVAEPDAHVVSKKRSCTCSEVLCQVLQDLLQECLCRSCLQTSAFAPRHSQRDATHPPSPAEGSLAMFKIHTIRPAQSPQRVHFQSSKRALFCNDGDSNHLKSGEG